MAIISYGSRHLGGFHIFAEGLAYFLIGTV